MALNGIPFTGPADILSLPLEVDHIDLTIERPGPHDALTFAVQRGPLTTGQPATRSFGEPTSGLTTDQAYILLAEDAAMWVTSGWVFDRTGRAYDEPLQPDEHVALDLTRRHDPDAPFVGAAREWLLSQPACRD